MITHRAYKVEIKPTNCQATKFRKNFGAKRFAYNFYISEAQKAKEMNQKFPTSIDLHKKLVLMKGTTQLPWAYEVSKCSFHNGLRDCEASFRRFFKKAGGFPKFKSKRNERQTFRLDGKIKISDSRLILPTIGSVKLKESSYIPTTGRITQATISAKAGRFFVSVLVEDEINETTPTPIRDTIGVDLGIKALATCSNGDVFDNPKALRKNTKALKRAQRKLSKAKKGSKNRAKAKLRVQKIHYRISNIRKDVLHKATTKITDENQVIVLEDLNVQGMLKNRHLARAIADVGLYEFRRQIEYKSKRKGRTVIFVDRFYPSSKTCSCCGHKKEILLLDERIFKCEKCGVHMDRDMNAAINLEQFYTVSSTGIKASGEGSSPDRSNCLVSPSVKEESDINLESTDFKFFKF